MNELKTDYLLEELRTNIQSTDRIKARLLMHHYSKSSNKIRRRIIFELSRSDDSFAIHILTYLVQILEHTPDIAKPVCQVLDSAFSEKPDLLNTVYIEPEIDFAKFVASFAMFPASAPCIRAFLPILNRETDQTIIGSILQLAGSGKNSEFIGNIADYLYSGNRLLVKEAITAFKRAASPAAVDALTQRLGTDRELDTFILDALSAISTKKSIEAFNQLINEPDAFIRNYAKSALIETGARALPLLYSNLQSTNSDQLVHTLNILGQIGNSAAATPIRKFLLQRTHDSNVRFAAYEALGMLPHKKGSYQLAQGLLDADEQVRVAAATALEKNKTAMVVQGIRNLMNTDEAGLRELAAAFSNAEAYFLVLDLVKDLPFRKAITDYLKHHATEDVNIRFARFFQLHNHNDLSGAINRSKEEEARSALNVFCIDDSRMILRIYKSTLHELDIEPRLFEFPETAVEQLLVEKPDVIFTDLNMPNLSGIDLTIKVREKYTPQQLPVFMITTQSDLANKTAALEAGVNNIIYKPFTVNDLKTALESVPGSSRLEQVTMVEGLPVS